MVRVGDALLLGNVTALQRVTLFSLATLLSLWPPCSLFGRLARLTANARPLIYTLETALAANRKPPVVSRIAVVNRICGCTPQTAQTAF